ncbi:MAG TPA: prepilin-type N-terminal cleavage/methylation domain-containing protein, partial [Thermodesulfobacteriota bacterium]|nr:prepilin-type N-terminal cleavage/methylation domain-containing protein [Thermodesulfobacteriota bacterium]
MKKRLDSLKVFSLGNGGSTLVEIIVALAITAILMAGVYGLYMAFFKKTSEQDLLIEAQQNARAGINMIEKELVLAGYRVPDETPLGTPLTSMVLADGSEIEFR